MYSSLINNETRHKFVCLKPQKQCKMFHVKYESCKVLSSVPFYLTTMYFLHCVMNFIF